MTVAANGPKVPAGINLSSQIEEGTIRPTRSFRDETFGGHFLLQVVDAAFLKQTPFH